MYCPHCGHLIDDRAAICVFCGIPVNGAYGHPVAQQPQRKKNNGYAIAGLIVGAGSIIGSGYLFLIGMLFDMAITFISTWCVSIIMCLAMPVTGIVLSSLGLAKSKNYNSSNALAIVGLVISIVMFLLWGAVCISAVSSGSFPA